MLSRNATTQMATFYSGSYVFPVIGGAATPHAVIEVQQLFGTAFKLPNGKFMTAGHVLENGQEWAEKTGLALFLGVTTGENKLYRWHRVLTGELYPKIDCAVLDCPTMTGKSWAWYHEPLPALSTIFSLGYAFGWDEQLNQVRVRAFKGNIVAYTLLSALPGRPKGYELSFACPRNLSGAPVLTDEEVPKVVGVVVGNSKTSIMVHSFTEKVENSSQPIHVEQHEVLNLGNAVCSTEVRSLLAPLE